MITCRVCGNYMDDKELVCPECGATVVAATSGGLSLKQNDEPAKKKTGNPMGVSVSTGSGLTDILRADMPEDVDVEDEFYGGSLPSSMARNSIDGDFSSKKKKSIAPTIIKLVLLVAVAFGIYTFVTKVILTSDKVSSKEDAFNTYMDVIKGVEDADIDSIIPPYTDKELFEACSYMQISGDIVSYEIKNSEMLSSKEVESLNNDLKLATGKTTKVEEACVMEVEMVVNPKIVKQTMTFVKIRNSWYLNPDNILN